MSLYVMLLQLEEHRPLDEEQVRWLVQHRLHGPLAGHYEAQFYKSGDPWELIEASSHWRSAGQPEKALFATDPLMDHSFDAADARTKSAILTTRGAAFRDCRRLSEAEECGLRATTYDPSRYQPCNLLGAVYFQSGDPERGYEYFVRAQRLHSPPNRQQNEMESALKDAGAEERRVAATYLLQRDPERYAWAELYLTLHSHARRQAHDR